MRRSGALAAAALYALDHPVERLAKDHAHAKRFAAGLNPIPGIAARVPPTHIVFAKVEGDRHHELARNLATPDALLTGAQSLQFVTHLDVDAAGADRAVSAVSDFMSA